MTDQGLALTIAHAGQSQLFDLDRLGMDDGSDERSDASFRLLFQLGLGYMVYALVIGMRQPGQDGSFLTLWRSDCAVAQVEPRELGPPERVEAPGIPLPLIYRICRVDSSEGSLEQRYRIVDMVFEASHGGTQRLSVCFRLRDPSASLVWDLRRGWVLEGAEGRQALPPTARVRFEEPVA